MPQTRHQKTKKSRRDKIFYGILLGFLAIALGVFFWARAQVMPGDATAPASKATSRKSSKSSSSVAKKPEKPKAPVLPAQGATLALARNFPDPDIIYLDGTYYAYGTVTTDYPSPMARSTDGHSYQMVGNFLSGTAPYSNGYSRTSPDVVKVGDRYVLYLDMSIGPFGPGRTFEIGTAVAPTPAGPFVPTAAPVVGPPAGNNANFFDPGVYQEKGQNYMFYATDGSFGNDIWVTALTGDGLSATGSPVRIMDFTTIRDPAGQPVTRVESPNLVRAADGTYVLIYAANDAALDNCYIGYATSRSVTGPYADQGALVTSDTFAGRLPGPGEPSIYRDPDGLHLAFNSWQTDVTGRQRYAYTMPFVWKDGHVPYFRAEVTP